MIRSRRSSVTPRRRSRRCRSSSPSKRGQRSTSSSGRPTSTPGGLRRSSASTTAQGRRPIDRIDHCLACSPVRIQDQVTSRSTARARGTCSSCAGEGARFLDGQHQRDATATRPSSRSREDYWGNVNPIGLRSMYDEAKRFGEACTMAYHRERERRHAHRPHLQHLRPRMHPADGRVVTSSSAGAARRADHGARRRHADQFLLRLRHCSRPACRHGGRCHKPINIGSPIDRIDIKCNRFGFEPEVTAKIAKMRPRLRIYEVGVAYYGRSYEEGKKITWKDGVKAILAIIRFRFSN